MLKSIAKKWVKALRSGKYEQGKKSLKSEQGYCCLGVLCSLSPYKNNYTRMRPKNEFDNKLTTKLINCLLPEKIQSWAGMSSADGRLGQTTLTSMNDSVYSFTEIADIIEKNYKKL
jgi:hypothetical protein